MASETVPSKNVARNQLELRRLSLLEEYFCLNRGVQSLLAEFRLNLARARSTSGAVGASVSDLLSSEKELEPAVWVETSEIAEGSSDFAFFTLKYAASKCTGTGNDLRERINKTAKEAGDAPHSEGSNHFRPFGILENQSVKASRKNIQALLPIFCDLANSQRQILLLDSEANN